MLVGATTSLAVRQGAVDALQHGFVPVVVGDAVADPSPSAHAASLADLADHVADVLPSAQVRDLLARLAPS